MCVTQGAFVLPLLVLGATCLTSAANAQTIAARPLPAAAWTSRESFSRVSRVREERDGQLIVLDEQEIRLLRVDPRSLRMTPLGRGGQGPGEYLLPITLVALPGDTTMVVDMSGGGRHILVTPHGVLGGPLRAPRAAATDVLFHTTQIAADAAGRLYELVSRVRMSGGSRVPADSSGIRRVDRRTGKVDTIGAISRQVVSPLLDPPSSGNASTSQVARAGGPLPPFASVDQWAVLPDGTVAVVSVRPYRVTFYRANGARVEGAVIPFQPVRMSAALKTRWRERRNQPVSTIMSGADGRMSAGRRTPRFTEPTAWPDVLPPFLSNAVHVASDGTLWIERTYDATGGQQFDVIDASGTLTKRVTLPLNTRLVGFGARAIYTVRIDDDDLEYLQRHPMP